MKFVVQHFEPGIVAFVQLPCGDWAKVYAYPGCSKMAARRRHKPQVNAADGDFEEEANSLEEFFSNHIEWWL